MATEAKRADQDNASCQRLIVRDELALERTDMANQRTFLAYTRTALAMLLAGVSFVHFANKAWFAVIGYLSLVLGGITLAIGINQFLLVRRFIDRIRRTDDGGQSRPPSAN